MLDNLRVATDYFIKAHTAPNELWGQVGEEAPDHSFWGPAEIMQMQRRAFKIDSTCGGSDLVQDVGSQVTQSNASTSTTITYQFTLAAGQTLGAGTNRLLAAQTNGTGTTHPTAGDTYTITYVSALPGSDTSKLFSGCRSPRRLRQPKKIADLFREMPVTFERRT